MKRKKRSMFIDFGFILNNFLIKLRTKQRAAEKAKFYYKRKMARNISELPERIGKEENKYFYRARSFLKTVIVK